jgi:hypothetical protein
MKRYLVTTISIAYAKDKDEAAKKAEKSIGEGSWSHMKIKEMDDEEVI